MVRRPPPPTDPTTTGPPTVGPAAAATTLQPVPRRRPRPEPSRVATRKRLLRKSGFSRGAASENPPHIYTSRNGSLSVFGVMEEASLQSMPLYL